MDKVVVDQAEGLRRLLTHRPLRIVVVLGAMRGAGATTAAVNLAAGLCHHGKRALVIDEHAAPVDGQATLADVVAGRAALEQAIMVRGDGAGAAVLAAPGQTRGLPPGPGGELAVAALEGHADVVLVDARLDRHGALSPLAALAHDIVIVMDADAASLTGAYAAIKRLHYAHANQQFRLLFNRVGRPADAQDIYQHLTGVATRYLGISLLPAGVVSCDGERIARAAALGGSVVSAFPAAPAAIDYRRVAAELLHWPWRPAASVPSRAGAAAAAAAPIRTGLRLSVEADAAHGSRGPSGARCAVNPHTA